MILARLPSLNIKCFGAFVGSFRRACMKEFGCFCLEYMLPASSSACVFCISVPLADKIPCFLTWVRFHFLSSFYSRLFDPIYVNQILWQRYGHKCNEVLLFIRAELVLVLVSLWPTLLFNLALISIRSVSRQCVWMRTAHLFGLYVSAKMAILRWVHGRRDGDTAVVVVRRCVFPQSPNAILEIVLILKGTGLMFMVCSRRLAQDPVLEN